MNGDGFADLLVRCGVPGDPIYVVFVAGGPGAVLGRLGSRLYNIDFSNLIGDVNGDGRGDMQVHDGSGTGGSIRYGVAGSEIAFTEGSASHQGQRLFSPINDVNGDGCDDVLQIVGSEARLFLGNPAGLSTTASMVLPFVR